MQARLPFALSLALTALACGAVEPLDSPAPSEIAETPRDGREPSLRLPPPPPEVAGRQPSRGWRAAPVVDVTLTDTTRNRDVPVRVFVPAESGPRPTVVISPGLGEDRAGFDYLGAALAADGFAVVALSHVGFGRDAIDAARASGGLGGFGDPETIHLRPEDLRFVLDQLEDDAVPPLRGRVDLARLAVGGQCAGASTALVLAGLDVDIGADVAAYRDPRPVAVFALGPQVPAGHLLENLSPTSYATVDRPAMYVVGTRDFVWIREVRADPGLVRAPFDGARHPDRHLVSVEGAGHHAFTDSEPWYPAGPRDPAHHGYIAEAVRTFLRARLLDDPEAARALRDHDLAAASGGAVTQASGRAPQAERYRESDAPFSVAVTQVVLPHPARENVEVQVTFPDAPGSAGPFPVVVFSHAVLDRKEDYPAFMAHWAARGYVVVQPDHLDSPNVGALSPTEAIAAWRTRPPDVAAVLDALPALQAGLPIRLDEARVGVGGAYIGGSTANYLVGARFFGADGPETFDDGRVRAALALSPTGVGGGLTEASWDGVTRPMMVVTGSNDGSRRTQNPPEWRTDPWRLAAPGDKYLLFREGLDGGYGGIADAVATPTARDVAALTLAFWDAHLRDDAAAQAYLRSSGPELASGGAAAVSVR